MFSCAGAASNNNCRVVITGLQGLPDFPFTTAGTVRFYFYMDNFFNYVVADQILLFVIYYKTYKKLYRQMHHQIPKQSKFFMPQLNSNFLFLVFIHSFIHSFKKSYQVTTV